MAKFKRALPDDPHQCQGTSTGYGRCPFQAMQDEQGNWMIYCARHGGVQEQRRSKEAEKGLYNLHRWTNRVNTLQKHEEAKGLAAELAILRMMLENKLLHCQDQASLILSSGSISDIIVKIEKLVRSVSYLNKQNGLLVDKAAVEKLASTLLDTVAEYILDGNVLEEICLRFDKAILNMNNANTTEPLPTDNSPRSTQTLTENLHELDSEESEES